MKIHKLRTFSLLLTGVMLAMGAVLLSPQTLNHRQVTRQIGPPGPDYALSNAQEYFAESCEAFFGSNDFYAYVRSELKSVEPRLYKLLFKL